MEILRSASPAAIAISLPPPDLFLSSWDHRPIHIPGSVSIDDAAGCGFRDSDAPAPSFSALMFFPLSEEEDDGDDEIKSVVYCSDSDSEQLCSLADADARARFDADESSETQRANSAPNAEDKWFDAVVGSLPGAEDYRTLEKTMLDRISVEKVGKEGVDGGELRAGRSITNFHMHGGGDLEKVAQKKQKLRRRESSVSDVDFSELKGCIDLGFRFDEGSVTRLSHILPALEVYCSVAHSFHGLSFPRRTPWRVTNPGDSPEDVKERLKHWAQAVACDLRLHR